ncbi:MAG: hypothetical protein H5T36_00600 [Methanobacteriaceae archaeon]|nr:hypothetical protein [Methanobacteriaceae archaeon]
MKNGSGKLEKSLKKFLKDKEFKNSEFIGAIIINLILLYLINNILSWKLSFILISFKDVIPILNIVVIANITANILYIVYKEEWFWSLSQVALNVISYIMLSTIYRVFPFYFKNIYVYYMVRGLLIVAMIVTLIAIFAHSIKFILKKGVEMNWCYRVL